MKKPLILTVFALGISSVCISQTSDKNLDSKAELINPATGEKTELIIDNPYVTIIPGEMVEIHVDGTVKNSNGVAIGRTNKSVVENSHLDPILNLIR